MKKFENCDIALVHPPYVFNIERYPIYPIPWNLRHEGSILATSYIGKYPAGPEGPAWNKMPLGFLTMKRYVENNSNKVVRIVNLAPSRQSFSPDILEKFSHLPVDDSVPAYFAEALSPEWVIKTIKSLKADLFAVDLHWHIYSQGAIQILKLLKQIHPKSYTAIGGLTASYFREEIMREFPFIDFLILGDGSVPLLELINQIQGECDFQNIPNLLYRRNGSIKKGPISAKNDFEHVKKDDQFYPAIPLARGCPLSCSACGGSKYAYEKLYGYKKINVYSVESIMKKLFVITKGLTPTPQIHLFHDPFVTLGVRKWQILLNEIKRNRLNVRFIIEFFMPHTKEDIKNIAKKIPGSTIYISPESMDVEVRAFHKKIRYSNRDLIMNMDLINDINDLSMTIWFMAGLAKDTKQSIDKTLFFVREYYRKLDNLKRRNIIKFTELLSIDPGSLAHDFEEKYGYKLMHHSFVEHMESFVMPIFKYQINYRTKFLSRDQLFGLFLYMRNEMNKIFYEHHFISFEYLERLTLYNNLLLKYSSRYDKAMEEKDKKVRNALFERIGNLFRDEMLNHPIRSMDCSARSVVH